jgi:GDP-L-fucose synthase
MNILITGADGFVGKNLSLLFRQNGYSILTPSIDELDLTSTASVADFFKGHDIDVIIHSATTLRIGTSYPTDVCENNLRMFFNLLKEKKASAKLINFGSGSEYSRAYWHEKMSEDFFGQHIPDDSHCLSKYIISKYIEDSNDANLITLRIFGVFGQFEDHRYKFISNAVTKNIKNLPIVINQNVIFDYLDVADFYHVVEFFCKNPSKSASYNITPTDSIDLITIAKIINVLGEQVSDIVVLNKGVGVNYSGCNARLLAAMPNFSFTSYRDSIANLYHYYRDNIGLIDEEALKKDKFLEYAKSLKSHYFKENINCEAK